MKKQEFRPDGAVQKKEDINNLKEIISELVDEIPDSDVPSKTNVIKKICAKLNISYPTYYARIKELKKMGLFY